MYNTSNDPATATINEVKLNPVTGVPRSNPPKYPPTTDPTIPKTIDPKSPPRDSRGSIKFATLPTISPKTIQSKIDIFCLTSFFSIPIVICARKNGCIAE